MRYQEAYKAGRERLMQAGAPEADLEARLLLEFVCDTDRTTLFAHPEKEVFPEQMEQYDVFLAKRSRREPLSYITGRQSFMGLVFSVNENVLIPRQDTEILVEEVMKEPFDGSRILDLCTGSGCILLSLLHYSNHCTGIGSDLSPGALSVAKENAKRLGMEEQAQFIESDLWEGIEGVFDIIVSNPPYIQTGVIETLMPEVREFEPRLALDGGEDGLMVYQRLLHKVGTHSKGGTRLYLEIGYDQGEAVSRMVREAGFTDVQVVKDYAGCDRVVSGVYRG
ncbi:MAG: peptide chain release factor N(5)-glutamine methyltransferase [Lachnospiraceae bacterium]|nr:peptide chain release factor N(5)-glutamine methyltransferase [Lachnospiraceae bacterium]